MIFPYVLRCFVTKNNCNHDEDNKPVVKKNKLIIIQQ